jgi:hypothetical protein
MINKKTNDKTKFFIRATSGSSMHFIGAVIWSLITNQIIVLTEKNKALIESRKMNQYHNFVKFWDYSTNQQNHMQHTETDIDLEESIQFFKNSIEFYDSPYPAYVVFTHAKNPDPQIMAFTNTKLINITFTDYDYDQQAYNWLIKTGINQKDVLKRHLQRFQNKFNKLKNITIDSIPLDSPQHHRLLTYIYKFATVEHKQKFMNAAFSDSYPQFNIKFSDITNGKFADQLDDLINFIGIETSQKRKDETIAMINEYASAQTAVPWTLDINDYE